MKIVYTFTDPDVYYNMKEWCQWCQLLDAVFVYDTLLTGYDEPYTVGMNLNKRRSGDIWEFADEHDALQFAIQFSEYVVSKDKAYGLDQR